MADTDIRRGLLTAEEEALKAKLSNISVPWGDGVNRRAKVWFGMPEKERERTYPFITIDLLDIVFAADRAHSAQIMEVDYWPSEYATFAEYAVAYGIPFDNTTTAAQAVWWHPYDLHFQVTTYARAQQHDRIMTRTLLGTAYLPDRWGYLQVPADNTERHLIRVGYASDDYYEGAGRDAKRTFKKIYNIVVTADMAPENPLLYRRVLQVFGTLHDTEDPGISASWTST